MDLRQLEIIRAIAETGSFTAAGHKLHVSQSAISRQILLLEDELKTPVFLRIGRRIRITPAGESLLQLSHRMFQDLTDTVAGIGDSQETLRGTVRILGGMTVCLYVFPTLLSELTAPASGHRGEDHQRQRRALHAAPARRHRRPGAADPADQGRRHGDRAGAAGRAAGRHRRQAPAHRRSARSAPQRPGAAAVRAVRVGLEHPPGDRRVLRRRQGSSRAS